jgi:hypothetical protein
MPGLEKMCLILLYNFNLFFSPAILGMEKYNILKNTQR